MIDDHARRSGVGNDRRDPGHLGTVARALRIALHNGVTPEEIVEAFVQIEAYAGAARAFEGYQVALQVFEETENAKPN